VFCGIRERAAAYVERFFREVAEDFDPRRLERARAAVEGDVEDRIDRDLPPFASEAARFAAALAATSGLCHLCGRRAPVRPKAPREGVCWCGRALPKREAAA
jgi:hypothetical protein